MTLSISKTLSSRTLKTWRCDFDLPGSGSPFYVRLSTLAFSIQRRGARAESAWIRISRQGVTETIDHGQSSKMITATLRMDALKEDVSMDEDLASYHQLLQE